MHSQQTGRFFDWKLAVWPGFYVKIRDARALFVEEISFTGGTWTGIVRLIISAVCPHLSPPYTSSMSQAFIEG
jgi:hypothetical protein